MSTRTRTPNNIENRRREGLGPEMIVCGNCDKYEWAFDFDRHKGFCSQMSPEASLRSILTTPNGLHALMVCKSCEYFNNINGDSNVNKDT